MKITMTVETGMNSAITFNIVTVSSVV